MTVKELKEKLEQFPEDMEVLSYEYEDIQYIEEEVYPFLPERAPESMRKQKYVIIG